MPDEKPKKPFALDAQQTAFTMRNIEKIRDQDNARLTPPPPPILRLDHPRLAPPGMKGITRTVKTGQNIDININLNLRIDEPSVSAREVGRQPARKTLQLGERGNARRDFQPLVHGRNSGRVR